MKDTHNSKNVIKGYFKIKQKPKKLIQSVKSTTAKIPVWGVLVGSPYIMLYFSFTMYYYYCCTGMD